MPYSNSADPANWPISGFAVTTLTTQGGKPTDSTTFMNSRVDAEVYDDGFTTTVLPAASAGASFQVRSSSGEFHGTIQATTPNGSHTV